MKRLRDWLSLVRFSHSVFALPFALQGAWLAERGSPALATLGWIVLCAVAARTAAMGFNRLADREIDARNPRTAGRELPSGRITPRAAAALVAISALVFVGAAFALNRLCGLLSLPVLAVLFGYSLLKRVSWLAHVALGVALALAPLGAWLAVRGAFDPDLEPVLWLALGVVSWVAGFDLIYACQDVEFDRRSGLHSIPARFGVGRALALSRLLHAGAVAAFALQGASAGLGWPFWVGLACAALLLAWEHSLVSPRDLTRVDLAFFTANGWVGIGLFLGLALDLARSGGVA
jgi:4-hydroxybenzoate polyprenyltransferase